MIRDVTTYPVPTGQCRGWGVDAAYLRITFSQMDWGSTNWPTVLLLPPLLTFPFFKLDAHLDTCTSTPKAFHQRKERHGNYVCTQK